VILSEFRDNKTSPRGEIVYQENTDKRVITDNPLLFRVQDQINGVMVVNWLPKKQHHMRSVSQSLRLSNLELAEAQFTNGTAEGKKTEF
jgi:hypothetical protein